MIDRVVQGTLTLLLGAASVYVLAQDYLPSSFPPAKQFSPIAKYFLPLIFAANVSWSILTNSIAQKSIPNQGTCYTGLVN